MSNGSITCYRRRRDACATGASTAATADWQASGLFDDRQRAALALTDLLTATEALSHAEDAAAAPVWDAAAAAFPGDELTQLVFTIAGINTWNRMMIAEAVATDD